MCHNSIDNVKYNGDFETKFGLMFCCFKCIVDRMKCFLLVNVFLNSQTESESEEEEQSNIVVENETDVINNEDNIIKLDDHDIECSEDKDKDKYDSEVDDEEDELVVGGFILQNQITDHYLDNWNDAGTHFSSNKIKYLTNIERKIIT